MIQLINRFLVFSFSFTFAAHAQDTIKVFQYNLLKYGVSSCTSLSDKNIYLKTILQHFKPDIIGVNELSANDQYAKNILNLTLNQNGISYYKKAKFTNEAGYSDLVNMLYYNSNKFTLGSQSVLNTYVRDINLYRLYYNDKDISTTHDTIWLNVIVMHLKAGDQSGDKNERESMVKNMMSHIKTKSGNYIVMGDFNLYSSSETAYQLMTNPSSGSIKFNDPLNESGNWHNNSSYDKIFTQSTRSTNNSNCATTGGMDDRFDFILLSDEIMNETKKVGYVPNTFKAIGQDGKHFNKSLTEPENKTLPSLVIAALYNMSDHLPVTLSLAIEGKTSGIKMANLNDKLKILNNPFTSNINFKIEGNTRPLSIKIFSYTGKLMSETTQHSNRFSIDATSWSPGLYIINVTDEEGSILINKKIIKM